MEGVMSTPTTRRGCLKVPSAPGTPNSLRKSVAFCAACDGLEEVHVADDWDRTATEPTKTPLSYQDILELKAIQRTLPRAPQLPDLYTGKPASQYLSAVPIGLLPLLPGDHPGTPHPTPVSTPSLTPTTSKEPTPAQTPNPSIPTSPDPLQTTNVPSSPPLDPSSPPMSPSKMPPNPLLELYPNPPHSPLSPPTPGHTPHFPYSYTYPNSHSTTPGHMPGRLKQPSPERATSKATQVQSSSAIWRNYSPPSHLPIGAKIPSNSSSPSHTPARVSSPAPSIPPSIPAPAPAPAVPSYLAHLLPKKPSGPPKRKPNLSFLPLLESTPAAPSPLSSQPFSPETRLHQQQQQHQPTSSPELVAQLEGSRGGSKTPTPESIARVLEGLAQVQSSTLPKPEPEPEPEPELGLGLGLESDSVSTTTPSSDSRTSSTCTSSTTTTAPSSAEVTPKICKAGLVSEDQRVNINLGSSLSSSTSCASDHHLHNEEEYEYEFEYRDTAPPTPALTTTSLMTETEESELETDVDVDGDEVPRLKSMKKGLGSQLRMTGIQDGEKDYFGSSLGLGLTRRVKPKERKPKEKKKEVMWINGMEVEIDGDDDDAVSEEEDLVVVQEKPKEKKKKKVIKKEKEVIWINGEMEEMETEVEVEVDDDDSEEDTPSSTTPSSKSSPKPKKPSLYHQSRSVPAGSLSQSTSTSSTSSCPSNLDSTLGFGLDPSSARSARRRKPPPPLLNNPGERIVSLPEIPTRARTPASSANVSPVESASGSGAASPVPPASPIDEAGPGLELPTPTTATVMADANPCSPGAGAGPSPPSNRFRLNIVGLA